MNKYKRLIIVGHMGAGKSLLGKALADKLGWAHIDTNIGIERYIGRTLNEIIGKPGAEAFYQCQKEILELYLKKDNIVITTEDSYILNEQNRKLLSPEHVIFLKVTTPVQIERMSYGPAPLFPIDPKAFFDKLHLERDKLFESVAKITVESKSVDDDVNTILKAIAE
ncbi:MAG: shikimate kinase [Candidatus Berkiellales bacterium]